MSNKKLGRPYTPVTYIVPYTVLEVKDLYFALTDMHADERLLHIMHLLPPELRRLMETRVWERRPEIE